MTPRRVLLAVGLSLVLAGACSEDELFSPAVPLYKGGAMFQRYVAMGNSITAGFQSGGINDSTQKQSYAVLVGAAMGGDHFYYPSLNPPGCPAPFTNIFTGARVGGAGPPCGFRSANLPPYLSNVAVPGAETVDMLVNGPPPTANSNPLTQLFLGGRTQVQVMRDAHPTFVSVWAGFNDLLGAAEAGDTTLATDTAAFRISYSQAVDSIAATGASAVLIAVGLGHLANNVVLPFFSRGTTWYGLWAGGAFATQAPFFTVAANCAPPRGDTVLVSFPYGFGLLAAGASTATTLDCTAAPVIEPAETRFFDTLQVRYNAIIQAQATARGWAFTDSVNVMMDSLAGVLPAGSQFSPFPNAAVACSGSPFGLAFSCDGLHPNQATQLKIARKIVRAINAKYGSAIPTP